MRQTKLHVSKCILVFVILVIYTVYIYEPNSIALLSCRNSGHLSNCQHHACPSHFKCPHSYCIPVHNVCDGKQDCPNGEEERYCFPISCPGFLLCRHDKVWVHHYDIWAGHVKCRKSLGDKALQDVAKCPGSCSCSGYALRCTSGKHFVLPLLSPLDLNYRGYFPLVH